ncbi:hypothetical protein MAM1_0102d05289 [Mucor ambiguus]|uniref:Uncharacterized protein n=1 Tax=Mucor ambiguus TaxID=91626 RepID=A0A0C9MUR3_9FUNG|nr:hypothetical protein MAM1_0102d05289 [Mucor ambiguus]
MPLNIATNISFEDENEDDVVDSKSNDNDTTANSVEANKGINGYAEQEATDDVALPPTTNYSEIWIHVGHDFSS